MLLALAVLLLGFQSVVAASPHSDRMTMDSMAHASSLSDQAVPADCQQCDSEHCCGMPHCPMAAHCVFFTALTGTPALPVRIDRGDQATSFFDAFLPAALISAIYRPPRA